MKTKIKKLTFADLPRDYADLCRVYLPRPLRDDADLAAATEIVHALAGFNLSEDQDDYLELVSSLIETYEDEHAPIPRRTPRQLLQRLLDQHGQTGADLSRILGAGKNLGNAILRGERAITADHARALGKHFSMPAGTFIE